MNRLKRMMLKKTLSRFADQLDAEDFEFVSEVMGDPRFTRLMSHVSDGPAVEEELRSTLEEKA